MATEKIGSFHTETYEVVQRLAKELCFKQWEGYSRSLAANTKPIVSVDFDARLVDDFRTEYLFSELLSKYTCFASSSPPREVALSEFEVQEAKNLRTNRRLRADSPCESYSRIVGRAQSYIRDVLGLKPHTRHLQWIVQSAYFGPGTNIGFRFDYTAQVDKMSRNQTCTAELLPFARAILAEHTDFSTLQTGDADGPCSPLEWRVCVADSKLTTVPKNAATDRVITVEPSLNSFIQGGIGRFIRQRLLRVGIDLRDQGRNQALAMYGSNYGYATIDLSQASNSLTVGLVYTMLGKTTGWYQLLDLCRSKRYTQDQEVKTFELFSGMGNGFTFPLESLVFWAISKAVMDDLSVVGDLAVYGDDIIVPVRAVDLLIEVFDYLGLSVNRKKTHVRGDFRESCGAHFYKGVPVKPLYIRRPIESVEDAVRVHNRIWEWATQSGYYFDLRVVPVLRWIRMRWKAPVVPPNLGDVGYYPLKTIGHPDKVSKWKVIHPVVKRFGYKGRHAQFVIESAIRAVKGPLGDPLGDLVESSDFDSRAFSRRSSDTKSRLRSTWALGYNFPYLKV